MNFTRSLLVCSLILTLSCSKPTPVAVNTIQDDSQPSGLETLSSPGSEPTGNDLIDKLFELGLFDPRAARAQRVRAVISDRTCWGHDEEAETNCWLVPGDSQRPRSIVLDNLHVVSAPEKTTPVDFAKEVQEDLEQMEMEKAKDGFSFSRPHMAAWGEITPHNSRLRPVFQAAWLISLGNKELGERLLGDVDQKETLVEEVRKELAWQEFNEAVNAYMVAEDEEALRHAQRLDSVFPDLVNEFGQGKWLLAELQRRKNEGTFGKRQSLPYAHADWPVQERVAHLITALEHVDARQSGQPGGVGLGLDERVRSLVEIGDEAIPALIDCVETDKRSTRSVHFWRDFHTQRTILSVREAALTAVEAILHIQVFEITATGDNFTLHGEAEAKRTAKRLREYWKDYGTLRLEQRMMKVLVNLNASSESRQEAARNLAYLGDEYGYFSTTVASASRKPNTEGPNPAIMKFENPTASEAMLAAMDRDLEQHDRTQKDDQLYDFCRRKLEDAYLFPLMYVGDERIADELLRRYRAADTIRMRRKWAYACFQLGKVEPLNEYARDFAEGKIKLPANDQPSTREEHQPGNVELRGIIEYLATASNPACDDALRTLVSPTHAYHQWIRSQMLRGWGGGLADEHPWFLHPFCLAILRAELDNTTATGGTYRIEGDTLKHVQGNGMSTGGIPDELANLAERNSEAAERVCDVAAQKLQGLVFGLPYYHPLFKDSDDRLQSLRIIFDSFRAGFRRMTEEEAEVIGPVDGGFVPDIQPLGRPATAEDVKAGKAVFHLSGEGRMTELTLPALTNWKKNENNELAASLLIVQAEIAPDGTTRLGVLGDGYARMVKAGEVATIKSFQQVLKENNDRLQESIEEMKREAAKRLDK